MRSRRRRGSSSARAPPSCARWWASTCWATACATPWTPTGRDPMLRYLAQRLLWMLAELLGISLITFVLAFLVPADPARLYAGPHASLATIRNIRHQLGLDQ